MKIYDNRSPTNEKHPTNHDSYGSNLYPIEKKICRFNPDFESHLNGHMEFYNRGEEKRLKKIQRGLQIV